MTGRKLGLQSCCPDISIDKSSKWWPENLKLYKRKTAVSIQKITVIFLYFLLYCCLYISTLYIPILNCGQIRQYQAYISVSVFIRPYRIIEFKAQLKFRYQVRPLWFISVIATMVGLLDIHILLSRYIHRQKFKMMTWKPEII
jgi:hypothetical protein